MFGMEIETRVPVTLAGIPADAYPKILVSTAQPVFRVDLDRVKDTGVLELVLPAFENHATQAGQCRAGFTTLFNRAYDVIDAFANAAPGDRLADLAATHGLTFEAGAHRQACMAMTIAPPGPAMASYAQRVGGPVHYTLGLALEVLPEFIRSRLVPLGVDDRAKAHARAACDLGAEMTDELVASPSKAALHGYIALLHLHCTSIFDGAAVGGQIKNRTQALCRVPWDVVFDSLTDEEQQWLQARENTLITRIRDAWFADPIGRPKTWSTEKVTDVEAMLQLLMSAAMGDAVLDPTDIWGKMTVVAGSEPVGPADNRMNGFALEFRHFPGQASRAALLDQTMELLLHDRAIHATFGRTATTRPRSRSTT